MNKYFGKSLIDFDGNRKNNFTFIRIFFAWIVLYGHSYPIQKVPGIKDPLNLIFQGSIWIGELAVNGFFAISGFLIAASIINRNIIDFSVARILRIYPALVVCVLSSVFVLGPLMTEASMSEYFFNSKTYKYLKNSLAFSYMEWTLPEVFNQNNRKSINGSLWTLTVEVRCYLLLAIVGVIGLLKYRLIANIFLMLLFLFSYNYFSEVPLLGEKLKWSRLSLYFLIGVFFYINRSNIFIDGKLALLALLIVGYSFGDKWFPYLFPLSFVYLIFYLAYATRYIAIDEKIGDISYGIYIYAWPIQQVVTQLTPSGNPYSNTIISSIIVFFFAYLSWHMIEKPILAKKKSILENVQLNICFIKKFLYKK